MSSSTFNFRAFWLWLAASVLVATIGLELVTRNFLFAASKDLRKFTHYPERADALMAAKGKRIAFLGNSLTERGVDPLAFGALTQSTADVFVADGSHLNTWYWIANRMFWQAHRNPDLFVLNFYENSLEDGKRFDAGRLAQFFTTPRDVPLLFATDVKTLEDRADFLVSFYWATYAVRERIKERVFGLIPNYGPYLEASNAINQAFEQRKQPTHKPAPSHETLARFIREAKAHGTPVLFVAFPSLPALPHIVAAQPRAPTDMPYELRPETLALLAQAQLPMIDLRRVPGLEPQHYTDDIHLSPEGQAIYTKALAAAYQQLIATTPPPTQLPEAP